MSLYIIPVWSCISQRTTQRCSSTMMLFLVVCVYVMHLIHGKSDTLTTRSDRLHIWAMHGHSHYRTSYFIVFGMSTKIWFHSWIYKKKCFVKNKNAPPQKKIFSFFSMQLFSADAMIFSKKKFFALENIKNALKSCS